MFRTLVLDKIEEHFSIQFPAPYWITNRANTIARLPVTRPILEANNTHEKITRF